jgi:hypothetical protein
LPIHHALSISSYCISFVPARFGLCSSKVCCQGEFDGSRVFYPSPIDPFRCVAALNGNKVQLFYLLATGKRFNDETHIISLVV